MASQTYHIRSWWTRRRTDGAGKLSSWSLDRADRIWQRMQYALKSTPTTVDGVGAAELEERLAPVFDDVAKWNRDHDWLGWWIDAGAVFVPMSRAAIPRPVLARVSP